MPILLNYFLLLDLLSSQRNPQKPLEQILENYCFTRKEFLTYFFLSLISSLRLCFCWVRPCRSADLDRIPLLVRSPLLTVSLSTRQVLGMTLGTKENMCSQPHLGLEGQKQQGKTISLLTLLACCLCLQKLSHHTDLSPQGILTLSQVLSF